MISFGSIVHTNFEMLSTVEPAAPSDEAPAVSPVGADFVGLTPARCALANPKGQVASARSDINIARPAKDGICRDGNIRVGRKAEIGSAAEKSSDYSLVISTH